MISSELHNWKFRCPRIAEFPFWIGLLVIVVLVSQSPVRAQSDGDLPALIKKNISHIADSLFMANGERWSGKVWSAVPDFRAVGDSGENNGFVLEDIRIEETNSSADPSGRVLSLVSVRVRGNLLLIEGKIIPVEVERALDVLHDQQMPLSERYPELLRKDSSLWSNVIQPVLVAVGAAAIIALFFFVRS